MRKFMTIAALLAASLTASAQYEAGTFSVQPKAGFSVSWLSNMPSVSAPNSGDKSLSKQVAVGLTGGADVEYQLTDMFSLSAGVGFTQAGSGWEDYSFNDNGVKYNVKDTKLELSYVTIPVTANCYVWKGLAVKAGVEFDFLADAKMKYTVTGSQGGTNTKTEVDEDFKDVCKKTDISIPIGVSYEFNNHLVLDARYNIGLNRVNKNTAAGHKDCKNGIFTLTIGYKIKL